MANTGNNISLITKPSTQISIPVWIHCKKRHTGSALCPQELHNTKKETWT